MRLVLQPMMATLFAVRDGIKDAHDGRPPYLWTIFTHAEHRRELLDEGWKAIAKIFILAVVLDVIYQFIVFRWFYPAETLNVGLLLAVVPYALLRGPVNRLTRARRLQ